MIDGLARGVARERPASRLFVIAERPPPVVALFEMESELRSNFIASGSIRLLHAFADSGMQLGSARRCQLYIHYVAIEGMGETKPHRYRAIWPLDVTGLFKKAFSARKTCAAFFDCDDTEIAGRGYCGSGELKPRNCRHFEQAPFCGIQAPELPRDHFRQIPRQRTFRSLRQLVQRFGRFSFSANSTYAAVQQFGNQGDHEKWMTISAQMDSARQLLESGVSLTADSHPLLEITCYFLRPKRAKSDLVRISTG